jgi:hypothetical protein
MRARISFRHQDDEIHEHSVSVPRIRGVGLTVHDELFGQVFFNSAERKRFVQEWQFHVPIELGFGLVFFCIMYRATMLNFYS